jgi:hypothetical protein
VVDYGLNLQEKNILKILISHESADPVELFREFIKSYVQQ